MLGTSLKVEPFNKLIAQVSPKCPRLLINREKAGQELHSGFDFEDKWKYTIQRDALFLGNCDEGVRALADLCGWEVTNQIASDQTRVCSLRFYSIGKTEITNMSCFIAIHWRY